MMVILCTVSEKERKYRRIRVARRSRDRVSCQGSKREQSRTAHTTRDDNGGVVFFPFGSLPSNEIPPPPTRHYIRFYNAMTEFRSHAIRPPPGAKYEAWRNPVPGWCSRFEFTARNQPHEKE